MRASEDRSATSEALSAGAGAIDDDALRRWLEASGPASGREDDRALSAAVLEVLLDVVNAAVFVVGRDGRMVLTNARARAILASHEELLQTFLHAGDASRPSPPGRWEVTAPSLGPLRICRETFLVSGARHALVTVESIDVTLEGILASTSTAWGLTTRQAGVFRLVLEGFSNKEIANTLRTSERTVEVHISALLDKAGVDSRTRLIAKTLGLGRRGAGPAETPRVEHSSTQRKR